MRLLADENIPATSISILREAAHDVVAITEGSAGIPDEQVLTLATIQRRVLLTFDRDYGALVYQEGLPAPAGIVFFRFLQPRPGEAADRLLGILAKSTLTLEGRFTVVTRSLVRQRPLPSSTGSPA